MHWDGGEGPTMYLSAARRSILALSPARGMRAADSTRAASVFSWLAKAARMGSNFSRLSSPSDSRVAGTCNPLA